MPRDKSLNAEKTSKAVKYYYEIARERGLVNDLLRVGNFKEQAILVAIRRGRISEQMIRAFSRVMGAEPGILKGEQDILLEGLDQTNTNNNVIVPSDEETIELLNIVFAVSKIAEIQVLDDKINAIKQDITKLVYELLPVTRKSLENYVINIKQLEPELDWSDS